MKSCCHCQGTALGELPAWGWGSSQAWGSGCVKGSSHLGRGFWAALWSCTENIPGGAWPQPTGAVGTAADWAVLPKPTVCPDWKADMTMKDRQNICFQEESVLWGRNKESIIKPRETISVMTKVLLSSPAYTWAEKNRSSFLKKEPVLLMAETAIWLQAWEPWWAWTARRCWTTRTLCSGDEVSAPGSCLDKLWHLTPKSGKSWQLESVLFL